MDHVNTQFNLTEFDLAYPAGIEHHYWTLSRNFLLAKSLENTGLRDEVMLEIGCGKGLVVAALRDRKMKCWGAELANVTPVMEAMKYVKSNTDATTLEESFRNQIRVLLFLDVLEHIEDPLNFLKNILNFFPFVTHLIITVPARKEIWSNYDTFYRHYRRYDLDMVNQLILQLKFHSLFTSYVFHSLYWATRLKFLFSNERPVKINAPDGVQKFIHRIIAQVIKMESRLLPNHWPGTSVFCIATKNS